MIKKLLGVFICIVVTSFYCSANAHGFTWFGLRNHDTEIFIGNTEHHDPPVPPHKPHHKKHKPKPPKHGHHKEPPKSHRCFWWCKYK